MLPHLSFKYSATSLLWHFRGFSSLQSKHASASRTFDIWSSIFRSDISLRNSPSYFCQSWVCFLYSFSSDWVGARFLICRYSIPHISLRKYRRSSRFENPASWETLFKRTSIRRFTSACLSDLKNSSADFFVKPIVNNFTYADSRLFVSSAPLRSNAIRAPCLS